MTTEKQDALVNVHVGATLSASNAPVTSDLSPIVSPSLDGDMPSDALAYLAQLRRSKSRSGAMSHAHVSEYQINTWRKYYPGFVRLEHDIELSSAGVELAKAHIKANALPVAEAMVSRATGTSNQAQRAGETVLEVAGVIEKQPLITINTQVQALSLELARTQAEEDKPHV